MYWTSLILVQPAGSLYSASPLKHHVTGIYYYCCCCCYRYHYRYHYHYHYHYQGYDVV